MSIVAFRGGLEGKHPYSGFYISTLIVSTELYQVYFLAAEIPGRTYLKRQCWMTFPPIIISRLLFSFFSKSTSFLLFFFYSQIPAAFQQSIYQRLYSF